MRVTRRCRASCWSSATRGAWGTRRTPTAYGDARRGHAREHVAGGGRPRTRRTSRRSVSGTSRAIEGRRRRAPTPGRGARPRDRALRGQGHDHRTLGDDGDPARRAVPAVPGRVPARDRRSRSRRRSADGILGNVPASGTEIIAELGRGAPPHGRADRLHERRLRLPDRDARGRRPAPDAVRVVPRRAPAADGPHTVGRVIARPFEGTAGRVRAFARTAGLRRAACRARRCSTASKRPACPCTGSARSATSSPARGSPRAGTRIRTTTGSS